jgi:hypothetical protein
MDTHTAYDFADQSADAYWRVRARKIGWQPAVYRREKELSVHVVGSALSRLPLIVASVRSGCVVASAPRRCGADAPANQSAGSIGRAMIRCSHSTMRSFLARFGREINIL